MENNCRVVSDEVWAERSTALEQNLGLEIPVWEECAEKTVFSTHQSQRIGSFPTMFDVICQGSHSVDVLA